MNILPQKYAQFKDKNYWDHFFNSLKNTQNEFFQWYGSYSDYKSLLQSLIMPGSSIFHVGCGKSTFSEDLLHDIPKLKIINCDYSENVIAEMKQRTEKLKINMEYRVMDLLQPLAQQYCQKFNVVLDKGTLDAMLPQDSAQNINKIKNNYFNNMEKCLIKQPKSQFIIISLLQPFVLRTILQHFGFQSDKYEVNIYESLIKNSKLQPFLVSIVFNPEQKQEKIVKYHSLGKEQVQKWSSLKEVSQNIQKKQQEISYGGRIKQLHAGRRTKFNIYNEKNKKQIRYILQIIDSEDKELLNKNTCSIFIVPQGRQNSYLFNDDQGIKTLHAQIKSSRLILAKLVTGNEFENLQKVKKQLNSVIPEFIQNGCDANKAPYLTDADELGQRSYLFQNEDFIIDEVLVEQEPIRRVFLRSNPTTPQCQFKLTYLSQNNNKYLKQINSKILPTKKNMVIGIDKQELFDDSARAIFAGLTGLYGSPKIGWKVLIIGCQFALTKFLHDLYENNEIVIICGEKKSIKNVTKYLQLQQSGRLEMIPTTPQAYFNQNPQQKFNIIIKCTNQQNGGQNPPRIYTNTKFKQEIIKHLQPPGLYVFQYWNYELPPILPEFFPVYGYSSSSKSDNILFGLRYERKFQQNKEINLLEIHKNHINWKSKSKPQYEWERDNWKDICMMQPSIKKKGDEFVYDKNSIYISNDEKFEDIYASENNEDKKANKKKKKKR